MYCFSEWRNNADEQGNSHDLDTETEEYIRIFYGSVFTIGFVVLIKCALLLNIFHLTKQTQSPILLGVFFGSLYVYYRFGKAIGMTKGLKLRLNQMRNAVTTVELYQFITQEGIGHEDPERREYFEQFALNNADKTRYQNKIARFLPKK